MKSRLLNNLKAGGFVPVLVSMAMALNRKKFRNFVLNLVMGRNSPILFLLLAVLATLVGSFLIQQTIEVTEKARFDRAVESVSESINAPSRIYDNVLNATKSYLNSNGTLDRGEFQRFLRGLNIPDRYPGIRGIGYIERVTAAQLDKHEQGLRAAGVGNYRVWPRNEGSTVFYPVVFFEPISNLVQEILGFDTATDRIRKEAIDQATDSGQTAFSRRLVFNQDALEPDVPGFVIYVPVYDRGNRYSNVEDRRKALKGFVYAPVPGLQFFRYLQRSIKADSATLRLRIYDQSAMSPDNLLFDSSEAGGVVEQPRHATTQFLPVQKWTLLIESTPAFESPIMRKVARSFFVLGLIISFLVYLTLRFAHRWNAELQADVHRQRQSEAALMEAQKKAEEANESKSRYLASMSHEIRTPLGVIIGFSELALERGHLDEETAKYLKTIRRNGQQLVTLVGDILDFSKIEADRMILEITKFSLPEVLDELTFSLGLRASEKGIKLIWDQSQPIPEFIKTDVTKFKQILINLINNAIKFTSQGEVRITPHLISPPVVGSTIKLQLLVSDTGKGIRDEFKKDLFTPFTQESATTTREYGGTGLGLSLAKKLSQLMGGDLTLQSSVVGRGSVFSVIVKGGAFEGFWQPRGNNRNPQAIAPQDATVSKESQLLAGVTVLLCDDSPDNQILFRRYLENYGASVDIADDGGEGLRLVAKKDYDVILMDIEMPGLDGYETTRLLRAKNYTQPIIGLSGHALELERKRALASGFTAYLVKPISATELVEKILQALSQSLPLTKSNEGQSRPPDESHLS